MVDGDAQVAGGPPQMGDSNSAPRVAAGGNPGGRGTPGGNGGGRPPQERRIKEHNTGPNGHMLTNRRGRRLCEKFQTGECPTAADGISCSRDAALAHQCAVCLSPGHGANACQGAAARNPHLKGKGKGGKKGGGGGRTSSGPH